MIRVLIADDQLLVRQGLRALLEMEPEISIAGEAGDGAEAIDRILSTSVDVVLLDIRMPKKNGIDVLREQLVGAIRAVAAGGTVFQPAVTQRLLGGIDRLRNNFDSLPQPDALTEREVEVVRLMAGGYSNREIAHALGAAEGNDQEPRVEHSLEVRRARSHPGRVEGVGKRGALTLALGLWPWALKA